MLKTVALVFFVFTSLVLGTLLIGKTHQSNVQAVENRAWQEKISRQDKEIDRLKVAAGELEHKRAQLAARNKATKQALLDAQATAVSTPAETGTAAPTPCGTDDKKKEPVNPFSGSIAKMMKDPATKNMMRGVQATALKQMYGDLVKQWSLSPEETQTFYDLLLDKQMDQMDQGMKFLEKGPDAVKTADTGDPDAKIKASLGDNLYRQYKDYEKTIPARFTVNQFQQQLVSSNTPMLLPAQSATLLQTITEESANMPAGSYGQMGGANGKSFAFDAAQMDQFAKNQSELNDRIDARMAGTISAEQLRVLKEQQQQMLSTQRMGMEMAAKMMAPCPRLDLKTRLRKVNLLVRIRSTR